MVGESWTMIPDFGRMVYGLVFHVQDLGGEGDRFRDYGVRPGATPVWGSGVEVSDFGFWVEGFGLRDSDFGLRFSVFGFSDSVDGFWFPGSGIRFTGSGLRDSVDGFWCAG